MKKIFSYPFQSVLLMNLLFLMVLPMEINAQTTDSTATPDPIQRFLINSTKSGVRSTALGNASVADYTELSSVYINPAVLSFVRNLKRIEFNSSQSWDNNLMLQNVSAPFLAVNKHRISLQTGILHRGWDLAKTPVSGLTSSPSLMLYRFDLAYAYSLTPTVSLGVLNSTSIAQKAQSNKTTNSVSFGMLYAPSKSVSYGVAFRGLGRNVGYEVADDGESELITLNKSESIELGATLTYPIDTDRTYFSFSIANEKRFDDPGLWYKAGLEVKLEILPVLPKIELRNGIIMQPESNVYAPTFGMGMDFKRFSGSLAISPGTQLRERFFQLGCIIHFDKF